MKLRLATLVLVLFFSCTKNTSEIFSTKRGALNGYDPVAYFTEQNPVPGRDNLTLRWRDAMWHFASEENLNLFKANPEQYAPQFGGYCAYGTSRGYKAKTDYDAWTIVDGKLYLNYNKEVQQKWLADRDSFILKAEANWPTVKLTEFK